MLGAVLIAVVGVIVVQMLYPRDALVPHVVIDGRAVGGLAKTEATTQLDAAYKKYRVALFAGAAAKKPVDEPTLEMIGVAADNGRRVEKLSYPWYMRLVPSSLWWWGKIGRTSEPAYLADTEKAAAYVAKTFGEECRFEPREPGVIVKDGKLTVEEAVSGGTCKSDDVVKLLASVKPTLTKKTDVRPDVTPILPVVATAEAEAIAREVEARLAAGVSVRAGDETVALEANAVRGWLTFGVADGVMQVGIDQEKAGETLREKLGEKVAAPAGVTRVTTHDFTETARQDGAPGRELDGEATGASIVRYVTAESDEAVAETRELPPRTEYTRTYSSTDTGLSAVIRHFAEDKPGTYGVSLVELSGNRRRAGYHETQKFTTASTYKIFVAYAALKRIEAGELSWSTEIAGGRNAQKCFDDMIVLSDNPCAEAFVKRFGYTPIHRDAQALGMTGTSFIDKESFKTTAADLANMMAMVEARQLPVSRENHDRLISALRRNVYRQGIPAGASGAVADKVGFLDGLLHDAAIVYSPSGIYALAIMTDGSSWANIAELTRQIEKIR